MHTKPKNLVVERPWFLHGNNQILACECDIIILLEYCIIFLLVHPHQLFTESKQFVSQLMETTRKTVDHLRYEIWHSCTLTYPTREHFLLNLWYFITIIATIGMTIVSVVNAIEIVLVFLVRWFPYHSKPPEPLNHHQISRSIGGMSWVTLEMVVQYLCAFSAVMPILDVTPHDRHSIPAILIKYEDSFWTGDSFTILNTYYTFAVLGQCQMFIIVIYYSLHVPPGSVSCGSPLLEN